MKQYLIYAKKLQNNIGNEASLVGKYPAQCKSEAEYMAMIDPVNHGFYDSMTFFAIPAKVENNE